MTDSGSHSLHLLLQALGEELHRALVNATGMNRVYALHNDRREWRGPALKNDLTFSGIDLNDLPRFLYSDPGPYLSAHSAEIWNETVEEMFTKRSVAKRAAIYFPSIAFEERNAAALVQLMVALWWQTSWSGATLELTKERIEMRIGGHVLGLDQRTAFQHQNRRRLPRGNVVCPSEIVASPLGKARLANSNTTAVFRHLCHALPDKVKELDIIFATAVMAGPEFQADINSHFDIYNIVPGTIEPETVWNDARRIISTAKLNPCSDLWALLRNRLSYGAFSARFGVLHVVNGQPYTSLLRGRHTKAVDELEGVRIQAAVVECVGDPAAAAKSLLNLQNLIGHQA